MPPTEDAVTIEPASKVSKFSDEEDSSSEDDQPSGNGLEWEMEMYLKQSKSSDPLHFWEDQVQLPILSFAAKKTLIIQASSALSERIFTYAGKFNLPERSCLNPDTLSALTLAKSGILNGLI